MVRFKLVDAANTAGIGATFSGASEEEGYDGIHTYQVNIASAASAITVGIDGSLDGVLWTELVEHAFTGGELTATTAMFNLTGKPVTFIRGNVKTLTQNATAGAGTDIENVVAVKQSIVKAMDRSVEDTDELSITINTNPYAVTADITTTHADAAAVYAALKVAIEAVEPITVTIDGDSLTFEANVAGTPYVINTDLSNDDASSTGVMTVTDSLSVANVEAVAQVEQTLLGVDMVDGDTISVTINGNDYATTFDATDADLDSHDEVMTAFALAITTGEVITAAFDGTLTITATANVAGTAFILNTDFAVTPAVELSVTILGRVA